MIEQTDTTIIEKNDNKSSTRVKLSSLFDAAIVFGIISAYLYSYGWLYWKGYFKYFGVDCFMKLSFEETICSSWWFLVLIFSPILITVIQVYFFERGKNDDNIHCSIGDIIFALATPFLCVAVTFYTNKIWQLIFYFVFLIVFRFLSAIYLRFKITFYRKFWLLIIFLLIVYSLILSFLSGISAAKEVINIDLPLGNYKIIKLTIEGENQPPQNAILVAHMDGKYIIYPQFQSRQGRPKTIVIDDSRVLNAEIEIVKKPKKYKENKTSKTEQNQ